LKGLTVGEFLETVEPFNSSTFQPYNLIRRASVYVAEIWRYPVKSMRGERLVEARLGPLGIEGDRVVHVENAEGRVITARTRPRLLGHHATLDASGEPLVDGRRWTDPAVATDVARVAGNGARLVKDETADRFDVLPLLVATDGAIAAFGHDGRRLRPNLIIGGVRGLDERGWPGRCLHIGEVEIALVDLRGRCVMTTYDPDSLEQNPDVLRQIVKRFGGTLALNALVVRGGRIREGARVELVKKEGCERHLAPA
jgi:MOSC domain-containing protein